MSARSIKSYSLPWDCAQAPKGNNPAFLETVIRSRQSMLTIMFSSAGRRVELIRCFQKDAEALGQQLRTVAVDLNPTMSPACQIADRSYEVPRSTEPAFVERLLEI